MPLPAHFKVSLRVNGTCRSVKLCEIIGRNVFQIMDQHVCCYSHAREQTQGPTLFSFTLSVKNSTLCLPDIHLIFVFIMSDIVINHFMARSLLTLIWFNVSLLFTPPQFLQVKRSRGPWQRCPTTPMNMTQILSLS